MRFSALPPVRRAVPLKRGHSGALRSLEHFFGDRKVTLYSSGTAALAQAIANCASRSSVKTPEVILPAYGCPDLVAASVHASVYPRLVDVATSGWSYDLGALKSSLSPNTVAVVAVNLLGIGDGSVELAALCKEHRISLIQDSAQHLPRERIQWSADYVILSFGRGKPLNLLHGGALASLEEREPASALPVHYSARQRLLSSRVAALAFNTLTRPSIYGIFSAIPGTGLGEVIYRPLSNPDPLPRQAWTQVAPAFELYRRAPSYRRDLWSAALQEWSELGLSALTLPGSPLPVEPLRLALLAPDRAVRDTLVDSFNREGLGASRFYGADLPSVAKIPSTVKLQAPFPNAVALADRLFTLPTHGFVNAHTVLTARKLVLAWHRSRKSIPAPP